MNNERSSTKPGPYVIAFSFHKDAIKCELHFHFKDGQLRLREVTPLVK